MTAILSFVGSGPGLRSAPAGTTARVPVRSRILARKAHDGVSLWNWRAAARASRQRGRGLDLPDRVAGGAVATSSSGGDEGKNNSGNRPGGGSGGGGSDSAGSRSGSGSDGEGGQNDRLSFAQQLAALGQRLKEIPAAFVAMLTALVTTLLNQRFQLIMDNRKKKVSQEELDEKMRMEVIDELRKEFEHYSIPLLRAAAYLQDAIWHIIAEDQSAKVSRVASPEKAPTRESAESAASAISWHDFDESDYAHLWRCYHFARLFGYMETIMKERPKMDFGKPVSDRFFRNMLGRLRYTLDASPHELDLLYKVYANEKSLPMSANCIDEDDKCSDACAIPRSLQALMGELMRTTRWNTSKTTSHLGLVNSGGTTGHQSILAFPDFVELYRHNDEFRKSFEHLSERVHYIQQSYIKKGQRLRCRRMELLQGVLLDLIEFLDPVPASVIPMYLRRPRLIQRAHTKSDNMPPFLANLYKVDVARLTDRRLRAKGAHLSPREVPIATSEEASCDKVHLFVKKSVTKPNSSSCGDDPFSQRVVLCLEALGIPYEQVPIDFSRKPLWFFNVHPKGRCPVIVHRDLVLDESHIIMDYLQKSLFPKRTVACTRANAEESGNEKKRKDPKRFSVRTFAPSVRPGIQDGDTTAAKPDPDELWRHFWSWLPTKIAAKDGVALALSSSSTAAKSQAPPIRAITEEAKSQTQNSVSESEAQVAASRRLEAFLKKLDASVQTYSGPLLGGKAVSEEDVFLFPFLYHMDVVHRRVIPVPGYSECSKLQSYVASFRQTDVFKRVRFVDKDIESEYNAILRGERDHASKTGTTSVLFSRF